MKEISLENSDKLNFKFLEEIAGDLKEFSKLIIDWVFLEYLFEIRMEQHPKINALIELAKYIDNTLMKEEILKVIDRFLATYNIQVKTAFYNGRVADLLNNLIAEVSKYFPLNVKYKSKTNWATNGWNIVRA